MALNPKQPTARWPRVSPAIYWGLGVSGLGSGCLPYVSPPVEVSMAVGPAVNAPEKRRTRPAPANPSGMVALRVSVHPLGLSGELIHRSFDPSFGLLFEGGTEDNTAELGGGFLGMDWFPWQSNHGVNRWRTRTFASLDVTGFEDSGGAEQTVFGGTMGVGIEYVGFALATPFATHNHGENDVDVAGLAHGEWAVGAMLGSSVRALPGANLWMGFVGITGRLPASIGFLCCFLPE